MNYSKVKRVVCVGVGGGGNYYIAKFFLLFGVEITGYDINESENVKELEDMGMTFIQGNPSDPFPDDTEVYIYSNALPDKILNKIKEKNPGVKPVEVGEFFNNLIEDYEQDKLSQFEKTAFKDSNIAPLYQIDFDKMKYIGVTGTDGKSTTCSMIYHILKSLGYKPAMVTTVSARIGDEDIDTGFHVTTPPAQDLYKFIKKIESAGCTHVILECTSHGLQMGRLAGAKFDVAVYTNITEEHLDYHGDWEGLVKAKSLLTTKHLKKDGISVINYDDEKSFGKLIELPGEKLIYGWDRNGYADKCKVCGSNVVSDEKGVRFDVSFDKREDSHAELNIIGEYNASNALSAISACSLLGIDIDSACKSLSSFVTVTGRTEILQSKPFKVIVDFAHTPGGLENVLKSMRRLVSPGGRVIVVFGCAGKRDPSKRSKMGRIAAEYANITILTAEDPRSEPLLEINEQIAEGWLEVRSDRGSIIRFDFDDRDVEVRRAAIKKALELAQKGDVVLITGKGHENSLCFGVDEFEWNDIAETKKLLGL